MRSLEDPGTCSVADGPTSVLTAVEYMNPSKFSVESTHTCVALMSLGFLLL